MTIQDIFKKKNKYASIPNVTMESVATVPDGMFQRCPKCKKAVYKKDIEQGLNSCPDCGNHFRLTAKERIEITCDEGSFVEFEANLVNENPLSFPGYDEKRAKYAKDSGIEEAVVTGTCEISGNKSVICIMDSSFMMGSMGRIVGEKITLAIENAIANKLPFIIFTASGGARMQEGIISLMQMAKVSGALAKLSNAGLLYVTVLTDPTTGGVTASFAMLGDIILAEKGALIGFAGQRVIEQTIQQKLPEGFQTAEFLLEHGFVDSVVDRKNLKDTLSTILKIHAGGKHNV